MINLGIVGLNFQNNLKEEQIIVLRIIFMQFFVNQSEE
jgi:hypothetical protein